jgi:hypothetical protein
VRLSTPTYLRDELPPLHTTNTLQPLKLPTLTNWQFIKDKRSDFLHFQYKSTLWILRSPSRFATHNQSICLSWHREPHALPSLPLGAHDQILLFHESQYCCHGRLCLLPYTCHGCIHKYAKGLRKWNSNFNIIFIQYGINQIMPYVTELPLHVLVHANYLSH